MSEQIIPQLEAAASIISGPPNIVTVEQRRSAEQVFLNFRKSKSPYLLCKEILETSQVHYVLFEASEVLKVALIREWQFLSESEIIPLRQYLMQYVFLKIDIPFFVQERLLQVIAIMVKRGSIADFGRELSTILSEIEGIIVNGDHIKKILGCKLILNLMQEYASTVKSTDVSLAWEVHFKVKKQFEVTELKRIFHFCFQLFSEIIKNEPPYHSETLQLIETLLTITVAILSWGYISPMLRKRLIGVYESVYEADQAPALRLSMSWHDVLFAPNLLPNMFELYWKIREHDALSHLSMTCLVQLATLNGGIMNSDDIKLQYLHRYLENFLKLLGMIRLNFKNSEALGISNIVRKLQLFFGHECLKLTSSSILDSYINNLTRITCRFAEQAQIEEAEMLEDKYFMDAFDNLLEAWASIFQESESGCSIELLPQAAKQIFTIYLKTRLAAPDGCRADYDSLEEIEDNEDNDRLKFKDQLQIIGVLGRIAISDSLPLLYKLLEDRSITLKRNLQTMRTHTMTLSDSAALDNLFEDIHWLILIAGHVLCIDSDGETPMIPVEVMQYSIQQHNEQESDLETTLEFIASVPQVDFHKNILNKCDDAIQTFTDVLKLCTLESSAAAVKLGHFMSPELGSTLMWFLRRWCLSYLLPHEHYYQEICPILIGTLGKDTDAAAFITNLVLEKILMNIGNFTSEPVLLKDTMDLFIDLVYNKRKSLYIVKTEAFWNIVKLQSTTKPGTLPQQCRRALFKGLVLAGGALSEDASPEYYTQILSPLQSRFKNILLQENFRRIYQEEYVKVEMVDILESYIGIAAGTQISTAHTIFEYVLPILSELPVFLSIYKNYQVIVQLILELFGQCARYMLCYLNHLDSIKLYDSSLATVKMYAEVNFNRFSTEIYREESSYQDLLLVLEFLTLILSKDCLDLSPDTFDTESNVTASEVSLFGLEFILPLIKMEFLMYPSLCAQYYKLIVSINELYADKIINLPENMLQQLLCSLELGLTKGFGVDILQASLDFIQGLATHICKNVLRESNIYNLLAPFLKLLIDLTLSHDIPADIIPSASVCIYSLMCCYSNQYKMIVCNLIQSQSDQRIAERLADAFTKLTENVLLNCEIQPKLKFRDNFDKFIANVHGFLLVK